MEIYYKAPFKKFVKKQPRPFQFIIEDEVDKIKYNSSIGNQKSGDLSKFRIHKFSFKRQIFLIAYLIVEDTLIHFYKIGAHESFYSELKRYIKEIGE
jgi:hypothetical protein